MTKPTDIRPVEVRTSTERIGFRAPIKFGGRVVTSAVLLNVTITVETRDGRRGEGFGSMPIGNVWAWPSGTVSTEQSEAAMLALGERLAVEAGEYQGTGHPLDVTRDLAEGHEAAASRVTKAAGLAEPMPKLAQMVAASPVEAALHDAFGRALGENSYNLLGPDFVSRDLAGYLTDDFAGEYLDR